MWLKLILLVFLSAQCADCLAPAEQLIHQSEQKAKSSLDSRTFGYRLPNDSIPLRYDLWLKTDVDKENFAFTGRVKIHLKIIESTQTITLHHRKIIIDNIDLLNSDGVVNHAGLLFNSDHFYEFLKISLPYSMSPNEEMILDILYNGTLRDDSLGFYRASYFTDTKQVYFATTQLEHTEARHAMPCYDEPQIRAPIGLKIQHDKSYNAISNMPIVSREPVDGTDYVVSKFQDTPSMQTYLLALIVSDFKFISNNDSSLEHRIFAKPASIDMGDADFAIEVVGPMLKKLEEHLGVPYPLPKMDHAAITDYVWGAMENFGLITYQERYLLLNPYSFWSSDFQRKQIIPIIAHETAHQFFGNIVAPKWWTYSWLSEGFATLYQYYIPSLLYPDDGYMELFEIECREFAFGSARDLNNYKPLSYYVESPKDIIGNFARGLYKKAGSVLRMFQETLTVPTFTKGLRYYLNAMNFSAATPDDLHEGLQRAYDEDFPGNKINLGEVMKTWEDQAGYPIVSVNKSGDNFVLTQRRFGGGSEVFGIPLVYATKSDPDFTNKTVDLWMTKESMEINAAKDDDWMILNVQNIGFYKVKYEDSVWEAIIEGLKADLEAFPPELRTQLMIEMKRLLTTEEIRVDMGIRLLSYLVGESLESAWNEASVINDFFTDHLFGTPAWSHYQQLIQSVTRPLMNRLGYETIEGEPSAVSSLRQEVKALNCKALDEGCLNHELNKLVAKLDSLSESNNLCDGIRLANETIFSIVVEKMLNADVALAYHDPYVYMLGLGCSLDKNLLQNYLRLVIDPENGLKYYDRKYLIELTVDKSVVALETVLDFILDNCNVIDKL